MGQRTPTNASRARTGRVNVEKEKKKETTTAELARERKRMKEAVKLTDKQVKDPKAFEKEFQGGDTFFPLSLEGWPSWGKRRSLDAQHILENTDFEKMIMEAKDDKEVGEIINYTGSLRKVAEQLTPEKHKQILKNVSPTKKDLKRRRKRKLDKQMQNIKKVKIA